jgi:ATP-dependent RNA helicase DHX37/DHR1
MPLESVVLSMKNMGIENVVNFPFPTPPDQGEIKKAERVLKDLGALGAAAGAGVGTIAKKSKGEEGLITDLGKAMALFPLTPRWAKMLVLGRQHGCMGYAIAMVAACSVGEPFLGEDEIFGARLDKVEEDGEDGEGAENEPEEKRAMRKKYFASREVVA